jgi:hypothetical protein
MFAHSLRGGAAWGCDCSDRERPFGWQVSARVGYRLLGYLEPGLAFGFLRLTERGTRFEAAGSEPGTSGFHSDALRDSTTALGPWFAAGGTLRWLERTPIAARLAAGAAILRISSETAGAFTGFVADEAGTTAPAEGTLVIGEPARTALVPFVSSELRAGYAFNAWLKADLGASLTLFLPPRITRERRAGLLNGPDRFRVGVLTLPDERELGSFIALTPSIAIRAEL